MAGGDRAAAKAEQVDVVELEALDLLGLGDQHRARRRPVAIVAAELAGLGDRVQVADEVAHRAARLAPRPVGGKLGEAREVDEALGGLGAGGEEPVAAQPDALDQAADEDVGAHLLERVRGRAVQAQEGLDPVARLGRELRALERRLERRDHVELAPAGDRRHLREVDRAQVDRRPGERADDRGRVTGVGEHPQPGEHVAHLGTLEEGRVAGEPERDAALLERRGDQPALAPARAGDHADTLGADLAGGEQVLDLAGDGLGLGAVVLTAPEANRPGSAQRRAQARSRPHPGAPPAATPSVASPALRKRRVACAGSQAPTRLPCGAERVEHAAMRRAGVLELVREHVAKARGRPPRETSARSRSSLPSSSTRSPPSRLPASRRMRSWRAKRSANSISRSARSRSAAVVAARSAATAHSRSAAGETASALSRSMRRSSRASRPGRVAADLVAAKRQLVDAVEQDREPVGRRRRW